MSQQQNEQNLLKRMLSFLRKGSSDEPVVAEYPIRARPNKIQVQEVYHYQLTIGEERTNLLEDEHKRNGQITIDIQSSQMGREAIADVALARHLESKRAARYGWLAFAQINNTDIHRRLNDVRAWDNPLKRAFPLNLPLLDKKAEQLEQRIEAGWHERLYISYSPQAPVRFPFDCRVSMSHDSAIPSEIYSRVDNPEYYLPTPTAQSAKEMAIHVWLGFTLHRFEDLSENECLINLERFEFEWPVPIVASLFELKDSTTGWLRVDSHQNRLIVGGIEAAFISEGVGGQLDAYLAFRLLIQQPSLLHGRHQLKGSFHVSIKGISLSGVRLQYFDALGTPQDQNLAQNPLLDYCSDLFADFDYQLNKTLTKPPMLLERYYSWYSTARRAASPSRDLQQVLMLGDFKIDETRTRDDAASLRYWVTKSLDSFPLIIDLELLKQDENAESHHYQLIIRSYYEGKWEIVAEQLEWLEKRLRQRLQIRN